MDKSLFWLTRLCERLRQDPQPVILYVGPVGGYLQALTGSAHLCSSHLWRVFKKEIGMSPMRFLRDTRLRQGAALLETTSLRISEIAVKVGFKDPLYFSRMFVGVFKCSPMAYRKRMKRA